MRTTPELDLPAAAPLAPRRDGSRVDALAVYVTRMAAGDQAALGEVYGATAKRVHALACRMLGSVHAAEEVVSDVYLKAWRSAATYDSSRGGVQTWLLVMCRSRALDALRARRTQSVSIDDLDPPHAAGNPHDLLESAEEGSRLHRCVAALAPLQRQLIALAFFRGYSHSEIAASTAIPLGSVKSHIRGALREMRRALEGANGH